MKKLVLSLLYIGFFILIFECKANVDADVLVINPFASETSLKAIDLRCEYFVNPIGISEPAPRLSWILKGDLEDRGQSQTGYRILVASSREKLDQDEGDLWDVESKSSETAQIVYKGKKLPPHTEAFWKVQVIDEKNRCSDWSAPAFWTMGLPAKESWQAEWIGFDSVEPSDAAWLPPAQEERIYRPAVQLRKDFELSDKPSRAVLYVTALGAVEPRINGQKVAEDYFTPGWSDYRKRLYYRAYDVTQMLNLGENTLSALLADGWFRGNVGSFGQNRYGKHTRLRAELHVFNASGCSQIITTDATWKASSGPILEADMQAGESYDARLEQSGWDAPGFSDKDWQPVAIEAEFEPNLIVAHPAPPVCRIAERPTIAVTQPEPDIYVFDLGQNFAGFARLKVNEPVGTVLTLRFAEMLKADGTVYTENLRSARVIDTYVCKGGGEEIWEPHFTFHGFRYVQVQGLTEPPPAATITGVVLSTDNTDTGAFESSSALLNRIWLNTRWSQYSNYFEVPTDCPQRDERIGWTGDTQVFLRSGAYNQDIAAFMSKWVTDIVDTQLPNGAFNNTAPVAYEGTAAGWADAGIIIPWTLWKLYGDTRVLEQNYEAMSRYIAYLHAQAPDFIGRKHGYGDWLPIGGITEKDLISTAYFAHVVRQMVDIAETLGKTDEAVDYRQLFNNICHGFQKHFINDDGSIGVRRTQTAHLLALRFNLLTPEQRQAAIPHLIKNLEDRNWRLGLGFLGVNLLLPTLTDIGITEGAYYTITGTEFPSWGYSIMQGATTIWERWNSFTKVRGFGDPTMNSFNHYAYGSCVEWMYRTMLGIEADEPGFARVIIKPEPGPGVVFAKGHYDSIRGLIATSWRVENGWLELEVTLPPNVSGEIFVPVDSLDNICESNRPASTSPGLKYLRNEDGMTVFGAGSGKYVFTAPYTYSSREILPPVPGKSNAAEEELGPKVLERRTLNILIGELLDNQQAYGALQEVIPEVISRQDLIDSREVTFAQMYIFAPDYYTPERLQKIADALERAISP